MDLNLTPGLFFIFLFSCRMERGHEEVLTSQVRSRRGTPQETLIVRSLVATISTEELRLYTQIPIEISLKTSDGTATTTIGEADNVIYFTREQIVAGLYLLVPSLVKLFLHFTQAPPALIHPNVFLDFDGLYCVELSLLVGYLAGGDLFYLHFEAWDWGPPVYVGP